MVQRRSVLGRPYLPTATSPTSFYKIILPSIVQDHKLRIPDDFAKEYWTELFNYATLAVPSGQVWQVRVKKANKMLWLCEGWREFAEYHSIHCGFFLVFNYVGNSKFNVLIFDLSGCEIHYPRKTLSIGGELNYRKLRPVSTCANVASETEFLDESRYQPHMLKLFELAPEFALRIDQHIGCCDLASLKSLRYKPHYVTRNKRQRMAAQREIVELENVNVSCKREHKDIEKHNSHRSVLDKPQEDKVIVVNINNEDKEHQHPAKDLALVDVSTVRCKGGQQLTLTDKEVQILFGRPQVTTQEREKVANAILMSMPKNPYFVKIMQKYNVQRNFILNLPSNFVREYLDGVESIALEVSGGRQWKVRCRGRGTRGRFQSLSKGWLTFAKENQLMEGDVCVFELIQSKNVVLKVSVCRELGNAEKSKPSEVILID